MAAILIVEDDRVLADAMGHLLRRTGHSPVLALDGRTALREALDLPDLILLDVVLPDLPGEEILRHLQGQPDTADIPVLIVTGHPEAAARLRIPKTGVLLGVYFKPVSGIQLSQAVDAALAIAAGRDADNNTQRQRQQELIRRLILEGPDALTFHVYRRLNADRVKTRGSPSADVLTWTEIAEWAKRERLLDAKQAMLLRRSAPARRPRGGERAT